MFKPTIDPSERPLGQRDCVPDPLEATVLATILSRGLAAYREVGFLTPNDFADPVHRGIFSAVQRLVSEGSALDPGARILHPGTPLAHFIRMLRQTRGRRACEKSVA
jgi:hypothetical protein